jgi:hypothetical protein
LLLKATKQILPYSDASSVILLHTKLLRKDPMYKEMRRCRRRWGRRLQPPLGKEVAARRRSWGKRPSPLGNEAGAIQKETAATTAPAVGGRRPPPPPPPPMGKEVATRRRSWGKKPSPLGNEAGAIRKEAAAAAVGKEAAATASATVGEGFPFFPVPKTSPCGAALIIGSSRAWTDQKARGGVMRPMVSRSTRRASGLRPHEGVVRPSRT